MFNGTAPSGLRLAPHVQIKGAAGRLRTPDEQRFVTITAAAELLGVEETEIKAMMRRGRLPFRKRAAENGPIILRDGVEFLLGKVLRAM